MMPQPATGMVPPNQQQQQPLQYQQPPPPQWMMMPPQQQQPPPHQGFQPQQPPVWGQQQPSQVPVPNPQQVQHPMMQMQQQQQYLAAQQQSPGEVKSLWIGDLLYWMDENYLYNIFGQTGEVTGVKIIKNKHSQQPEGYGFIEFISRAAAERVLLTYNNTLMPNSEQSFKLNWATLGAGERRQDEGPDYTIFVGDLAADVTDYVLQETFKVHYPSVKGAKVVTDRITGRTKGYGFVRFADEAEQQRAMVEMNGAVCSTRPMRIGPAATKKPAGGQQYQRASFPNSQGTPGETDPNNTTIFVGGLDESVTDDQLRQAFGRFGELVHVKIPVGKRCGFVQFSERSSAEQALSLLNGSQLGGQNIRLSWGRSPSNKQAQPDQGQGQWNGAPYYGYSQGYESYGYAPPQQDPSMYYGAYPGYGNYQQQQQQQQQQQ